MKTITNRFPALPSAEPSHGSQNDIHQETQSQAFEHNYNQLGSQNQEKIQNFSRSYNQPSNQRMFQGTFESRQITTENTDAPVITDANLYIKNIDYDISDEALYNVFSKLGEITSHHIVRDTMKRSRGFGFMSYRTIEQAKKAIEQANGMFIGNKPVVVMLHIKKDQRRMQKLVMKETMGATLQTRPNYNIASSQSQFKLQQGSHLHQNMLDGPYASKGNRLGLGHHTPGHHNQGHHVPGHHNHNQGHNTPGGLGYEHPTRGLSHPGRPGQGQGFPQELAEYQREYESNQTDMYMARKNPYPQDLPWDGYPNRHSHLEERFAAQQNSTQFFQHGKKLPTPVDMYGPMMALDKRQRALQQRSELYEASRASPDHPSFDPSLLSAAGKINQWGERERERGPESYSTSRSSATSRSTATPPLFLQDQQQWMDLGSPTTHDLNYSPSSWTPTLSPRGGPSTPSYDSYGFATGKAIVSPRTSYTQDRERESITTSSNQSSMIDQLPDIISRRPSVISADADRERPQFPLDRPFTAHSIGRQSSPLQRDSLGPLPGQGAGQGAGGCFLLAEPGMQRSQLSSRLLPLVEAKSSHARKITDYLVLNAPYNELQQLLETPDLLLPHYISAALSKMGA